MLASNVMMVRKLEGFCIFVKRVIGDFWERGLVSPISLRRWARSVTLEEYSQFHLVLLSTPAFYAARSWEQIKALVMSNADWNALLCNYHGTYGFAFKFRPGFGPKNAKEGTFYVYTGEASYYVRNSGARRESADTWIAEDVWGLDEDKDGLHLIPASSSVLAWDSRSW